jgi:nitroimidazol reductase NimA-like FMN-containing flavoprotein (pyridoxamine 5'-phosphate oxidase superfamily)
MQKYHLNNRPNREIKTDTEILGILRNGKYVSISMCRENEPYIVTLSYGYDSESNSLYFHSSPEGLKIDFIKSNPLVCATIIEDGGYVINECEHNYRTVVFWGEMFIVHDLEEKKHGMSILLNHLEKDPDRKKEMLLKSLDLGVKMTVLKLEINQIHGKEGK